MKGERFPHDETVPGSRLTLSLGVASVTQEIRDYRELIRHADEALYSAKRAGRDRVS